MKNAQPDLVVRSAVFWISLQFATEKAVSLLALFLITWLCGAEQFGMAALGVSVALPISFCFRAFADFLFVKGDDCRAFVRGTMQVCAMFILAGVMVNIAFASILMLLDFPDTVVATAFAATAIIVLTGFGCVAEGVLNGERRVRSAAMRKVISAIGAMGVGVFAASSSISGWSLVLHGTAFALIACVYGWVATGVQFPRSRPTDATEGLTFVRTVFAMNALGQAGPRLLEWAAAASIGYAAVTAIRLSIQAIESAAGVTFSIVENAILTFTRSDYSDRRANMIFLFIHYLAIASSALVLSLCGMVVATIFYLPGFDELRPFMFVPIALSTVWIAYSFDFPLRTYLKLKMEYQHIWAIAVVTFVGLLLLQGGFSLMAPDLSYIGYVISTFFTAFFVFWRFKRRYKTVHIEKNIVIALVIFVIITLSCGSFAYILISMSSAPPILKISLFTGWGLATIAAFAAYFYHDTLQIARIFQRLTRP